MSRKPIKHFPLNELPKHFDNDGKNGDSEKTWQEEQEEDVRQRKSFRAKTKNQEKFVNGILTSVLTIGTGPSGTGRSFVSVAIASQLLLADKIEKIIVTKPIIPCGGQGKGFLPGDSFEKMKPFINQLIDYFIDFLGKKTVDKFIKEEKIVFCPIDEMRGSSFSNLCLIADECQNLNEIQLKMLVTRIGENCRFGNLSLCSHHWPALRTIRSSYLDMYYKDGSQSSKRTFLLRNLD